MNTISTKIKVVSAIVFILFGFAAMNPALVSARGSGAPPAEPSAPVILRHEGLPPAGMLPTSPFYFLKRFGESIITFFTFGDGNKAVRHFELAKQRLAEAEELAAQKEFDAAKPVFGNYDDELKKTQEQLEAAELRGLDMSKLAENILKILPISPATSTAAEVKLRTEQAQNVLERVSETAPEQAQRGLDAAEASLQQAAQKALVKKQNSEGHGGGESGSGYVGSDKFGFCDGFLSRSISEDIQDTKALGFGWGRPFGDVFAEETVEKNGSYDFSTPDSVVKQMQSSGLKIFGTLFPTGMPKISNSVDAASFGNYVKAVVKQYKGTIAYWEVGIEPFCSSKGETCYKNFLELVKTAYEAAKSVDPSIMISAGGAAPVYDPYGKTDSMVSSIFGYFFQNGGANYIDFFNFHYLVGSKTTDIKKYVDYWKEYLPAGKEIWLSETGSRDVGDRYTVSSDADTEASWVKSHIADSLGSGVSKIFWCRAEHSFSDMTKVVEALQEESRQYGGNPSGSVAKRQTSQGGQQQGGQAQQSSGTQQQSSQTQQQSGQMQQQQGGQTQQSGGQQMQSGGMQPQSGGKCGDGICDPIEKQTGGCPQDCK